MAEIYEFCNSVTETIKVSEKLESTNIRPTHTHMHIHTYLHNKKIQADTEKEENSGTFAESCHQLVINVVSGVYSTGECIFLLSLLLSPFCGYVRVCVCVTYIMRLRLGGQTCLAKVCKKAPEQRN